MEGLKSKNFEGNRQKSDMEGLKSNHFEGNRQVIDTEGSKGNHFEGIRQKLDMEGLMRSVENYREELVELNTKLYSYSVTEKANEYLSQEIKVLREVTERTQAEINERYEQLSSTISQRNLKVASFIKEKVYTLQQELDAKENEICSLKMENQELRKKNLEMRIFEEECEMLRRKNNEIRSKQIRDLKKLLTVEIEMEQLKEGKEILETTKSIETSKIYGLLQKFEFVRLHIEEFHKTEFKKRVIEMQAKLEDQRIKLQISKEEIMHVKTEMLDKHTSFEKTLRSYESQLEERQKLSREWEMKYTECVASVEVFKEILNLDSEIADYRALLENQKNKEEESVQLVVGEQSEQVDKKTEQESVQLGAGEQSEQVDLNTEQESVQLVACGQPGQVDKNTGQESVQLVVGGQSEQVDINTEQGSVQLVAGGQSEQADKKTDQESVQLVVAGQSEKVDINTEQESVGTFAIKQADKDSSSETDSSDSE